MIKKMTINQTKIAILLASYAVSLTAVSAVNAIFLKNGLPFIRDEVSKREVLSITEDSNGTMNSRYELIEYYGKLKKEIITVYDNEVFLYNFNEVDNVTYLCLVNEAMDSITEFKKYYDYCKRNIYGINEPIKLNIPLDGYDPSIPYLYANYQGKTGNTKKEIESKGNNILVTAYLAAIAGIFTPFIAIHGCVAIDDKEEKKKILNNEK